MGRSWPSLMHPECSENIYERLDNGTLVLVSGPPEHEGLAGSFDDEEFVKTYISPTKRRVQNCWTCSTCDFQLEAEQEDGNVTAFHFLEYSGTTQLAEDSTYRLNMFWFLPVSAYAPHSLPAYLKFTA